MYEVYFYFLNFSWLEYVLLGIISMKKIPIKLLRLISSEHLQRNGGINVIQPPEPEMPLGKLLAPSTALGQLNAL